MNERDASALMKFYTDGRKEGDFEYEFDVEVRPEFELPQYEGLKIRRPVREVTDADVQP